MRIISGRWRGRILPARVPPETRPTLDAVREAVFNILSTRIEWSGRRVLDVFAGTGALGLEALSRGASWCTFVERSANACKAIVENCRALRVEREFYAVVRADAVKYLRSATEQFDVVFADPPYGNATMVQLLIEAIQEANCIAPEAVVVVEHAASIALPVPLRYELLVHRCWGKTACTIFLRQ